jgi:hypothetical protein
MNCKEPIETPNGCYWCRWAGAEHGGGATSAAAGSHAMARVVVAAGRARVASSSAGHPRIISGRPDVRDARRDGWGLACAF